MKTLLLKQITSLFLLSLFSASMAFAQQNNSCKVLMKEISGSYKGGCNNGLAEGKGTAKGEDTYSGSFVNGLPDGKGEYTYSNGNVFTGYWKKGLKEGEGKFRYSINGKQTILAGYWKNGEYAGPSKPGEDYSITNLSGIENYSITKVADSGKLVEISFERVMKKYIPDDLSVTLSSGYKIEQNKKMVIQNFVYPLTCELHFSLPVAMDRKQCNFTFKIMAAGKYEVFISNN
jgi:hypothetical protein